MTEPSPESGPGLWRVYVPEWVTVYTADALGAAGADEASAVLAERWEGRVLFQDAQVVEADSSYRIQLRLPNLRSEWKEYGDAMGNVPSGTGAAVVRAGSAAERSLLDYGKRKLPA